jgi:hypothetical protein
MKNQLENKIAEISSSKKDKGIKVIITETQLKRLVSKLILLNETELYNKINKML